MQAILDAFVAREVTARLGIGNNMIRAEGISGLKEENGEHDRTTVFEGANYTTEGR